MEPQLNTDHDASLLHTQRIMRAPDADGHIMTWGHQVNAHVIQLLGADCAVLALPRRRRYTCICTNTDPDFANELVSFFAGAPSIYAVFSSEVGTHVQRALRRLGSAAFHERVLIPNRQAFEQTRFYRKVLRPRQMNYYMGLTTRTSQGEAVLFASFQDQDAKYFGHEGLERLRLLVPAFADGIRHLQSPPDQPDLFGHVLNAIPQALAVFDEAGRELYRNEAMERLLGEANASKTGLSNALYAEIGKITEKLHVSRRLASTVRAANGAMRSFLPDEYQHRVGAYNLKVTYVERGGAHSNAVMVTATRDTATLPELDVLQAQYGLTPREAEVALHVAEGATNAALADRLCISKHTVKRHVEQVLNKLNVPSRSAVALTLLQRK